MFSQTIFLTVFNASHNPISTINLCEAYIKIRINQKVWFSGHNRGNVFPLINNKNQLKYTYIIPPDITVHPVM